MAPRQYARNFAFHEKFPLTRRARPIIDSNIDVVSAINEPHFGKIIDPRFAPNIWTEFPISKSHQRSQGKFSVRNTSLTYTPGLKQGQKRPQKVRRSSSGRAIEKSARQPEVTYGRPSSRTALPSKFKEGLHRSLRAYPTHEKAVRWYLDHQADENAITVRTKWQENIEELFTLRERLGPAKTLHWMEEKIGEGGHGRLYRCTLQQENTTVLEIGMKTTLLDDFYGDYCAEGHFTSRLNAAGCNNIIKVLGWCPLNTPFISRQYWEAKIASEYCPHGDLSHIYHFYRGLKNINGALTLPESFLWHLFHGIATAICYNANGSTKRKERPPGWTPIVHQDIKAGNILIDEPDPILRSVYPTIKLCDYGLAYSYPNQDIVYFKRAQYQQSTQGIMAPEADHYVRSDPRQTPYSLAGVSADVYSLGILMREFMRIPTRGWDSADSGILDLTMPFSYKYFPYSKDLFDLVSQCVNPDSRKRPDVQELFEKTRKSADASYRGVSISAASPGPEGSYDGQVLWNDMLRGRYSQDPVFARAIRARDWKHKHRAELQKLQSVWNAVLPNYDRPPGHYVVGNGLGPATKLTRLRQFLRTVEDSRSTAQWRSPVEVVGSNGQISRSSDGSIVYRYIGRDRLEPIHFDPFWDKDTNDENSSDKLPESKSNNAS